MGRPLLPARRLMGRRRTPLLRWSLGRSEARRLAMWRWGRRRFRHVDGRTRRHGGRSRCEGRRSGGWLVVRFLGAGPAKFLAQGVVAIAHGTKAPSRVTHDAPAGMSVKYQPPRPDATWASTGTCLQQTDVSPAPILAGLLQERRGRKLTRLSQLGRRLRPRQDEGTTRSVAGEGQTCRSRCSAATLGVEGGVGRVVDWCTWGPKTAGTLI